MRYRPAAAFAKVLASRVAEKGLPRDVYLNVNVPARPIRGVVLAHQGKRIYHDGVSAKRQKNGETVFKIGGYPEWENQPGSDFASFRAGFITITPLQVNMTDRKAMKKLQSWRLSVPAGAAPSQAPAARGRRK